MLRRSRTLRSGEEWTSYYYNGRDVNGKRIEIPLGSDLNEAKRKWAELECRSAPQETGLMRFIFDRYARDVIPQKAARTQIDNEAELSKLRRVFDDAPIDGITPQHIAQYRDNRGAQAKTRANREIALLSHVFNMAREWGFTAHENPCRGVKRNKETPRRFYADDEVWNAVIAQSPPELKDAMLLAYQTGQRPSDVLKMRWSDIKEEALEIQQGKTGKRLRILLSENGTQTGLGLLIDKIKLRAVSGFFIVSTPNGQPLNKWTLRIRFESAKVNAAALTEDAELSSRIAQFQFRDIRPKAASEIEIGHAQALLGHSKEQITQAVYRRVGATVRSTT
jgi:integrase